MNKIAILCTWVYEKVMRPNILAFPRTILHKLVLLHITLYAYRYNCSTVNRYAIHYFVLENQQSINQKTMETIWHGAKSLAYRLRAECFVSNEQNCNSLYMGLRKSNASKHIGFSQNHITQACSFAYHPIRLQVYLQHSQQICNTLFCSGKSAIDKSKDALDQLI